MSYGINRQAKMDKMDLKQRRVKENGKENKIGRRERMRKMERKKESLTQKEVGS